MLAVISMFCAACGSGDESGGAAPDATVAAGREIFRHDTFGDERFWTDTLRMHEVIASAVDPKTALSVGLKVDSEALPAGILDNADLEDPQTTLALLELGAVVGVEGTVEDSSSGKVLTSVGVTCALCHSTVDDSVAPGIGRRLDGYPNRDLDPGLILSLSPAMQSPELQAVLKSWGPGKYDAYFNLDGLNDPVLIPPAFGLADVPLETYTGEGEISYWNAYVAVTQMGGQGSFSDQRLGIDIEADPDLVTPKLEALRAYQLSLDAPAAPEGSFDPDAAERGEELFRGEAGCADCHSGSAFTDAARRLYDPEDVGTDAVLAERSTTGKYRATPLRGAWEHPPYFHDGSAASLDDVVEHYDEQFDLRLGEAEKKDLVEFLKSL
jgi:mono/diheme cytochrome c family protein